MVKTPQIAALPGMTPLGFKPRAVRVQIPAYTDRWMMGDRYGEVTLYGRLRNSKGEMADIVRVRLDKSGKSVRVWLSDCVEV